MVFNALIGRGGGIRTHDLFVPNEARYQAALRPDMIGFGATTGVMYCPGAISRKEKFRCSEFLLDGFEGEEKVLPALEAGLDGELLAGEAGADFVE